MNQQTEPKTESAQTAQAENLQLETQGKTTNTMDKQEENKQQLLRIKTGALSVLSYSPTCSIRA